MTKQVYYGHLDYAIKCYPHSRYLVTVELLTIYLNSILYVIGCTRIVFSGFSSETKQSLFKEFILSEHDRLPTSKIQILVGAHS